MNSSKVISLITFTNVEFDSLLRIVQSVETAAYSEHYAKYTIIKSVL